MTITNEPGTLSRLAEPGVAGRTGTSFQSDTGNSGGNGLRTRPMFEDACVTALEDFRRDRIDRAAVTTRIAIAVASACLPNAEETETFKRYFSFIERDENELCSVGSETRAGRTGLGNSPSEARAGEKHGQGDETDEESRSRTIQSEAVRASKRHKRDRESVQETKEEDLFPQMDHPASSGMSRVLTLMSHLTSQTSLHQRLSDCPLRSSIARKSSWTSDISNEPRRLLK
jgi:hypothetical protein